MHSAATTSRAELSGGGAALAAQVDGWLSRPGAASADAFDRVAAAPDASHYLLTPSAVVAPTGAHEVARLLRGARTTGTSVTFRSGGTSLSGQSSSDALLVDTRRHFQAVHVAAEGDRITFEPGVTVRRANQALEPFGRKLGPDPASEIACTLGGVIANNSSGMACGTEQNTYQTIRSAVLVLPSGTIIDTADDDADDQLARHEPKIHAELAALRDEIRGDPVHVAEIRRQFAIKNTMGYGLNSFLDHDTPIEILLHLAVGSEGTLLFVAEATFNTVPLLRHAATGLLLFDRLASAAASLPQIVATGAATVELLDRASLDVLATDPVARAVLPEHGAAALLIEYQAGAAHELDRARALATPVLGSLGAHEHELTTDPTERALLWRLRKGLYAAIAGARPSGTTALLEDVAAPVARVADLCGGLADLFESHGYGDTVIFGHAKDGNLHFLLTEDFGSTTGLGRYARFTDDMVDLVLGLGGTLKAEHGTGRIMAPFVRRQFGEDLYRIMLRIKAIIDPGSIMNPGAVITDDPRAHLRNLKTTPVVEPEVDRCVECGYCEPVCPSRNLTLTPRQRIVIRRARAATTDAVLDAELARTEQYQSVDTCAADGMCETACPVGIDTGALVRRVRASSLGPTETRIWGVAGRRWASATRTAGAALSAASHLPAPAVEGPNRLLRRLLGPGRVPMWAPDLPSGGTRRRTLLSRPPLSPAAVFFPSCLGSMFAPASGGVGSGPAFASLAERAGIDLVMPNRIDSLCCGTPWKSKGHSGAFAAMADRTAAALRESGASALPVVCDSTSCAEGLRDLLAHAAGDDPGLADVVVVDAVTFTETVLMPRLVVTETVGSVVIHPTCAGERSGVNPSLVRLASAVANAVTVPEWGCCAFAGDRGLLRPELTASATLREADAVTADAFDAHCSSNRTCEIAMERATGRPYTHVLELVDQATRPI